jgi:hypothetical protein
MVTTVALPRLAIRTQRGQRSAQAQAVPPLFSVLKGGAGLHSQAGDEEETEGVRFAHRVQRQFDRVAGTYDKGASGDFHAPLAARLLHLCDPQPGERLLDVASGHSHSMQRACSSVSCWA